MGSPRTVNRFISAPVQTPSTPGTGTGGGTGGAVATKYDRYIGTLGSLANRPAGQKVAVSSATGIIQAEQRESLISSLAPALLDQLDRPGYALGMPFIPSVDGRIVAIRYYKAAGETGTHTGKIWSSTGVELRRQAFTNETASGWQEVALRIPVTVTAGNVYIVSVNVNRAYVATAGGLATAVTSANLTSSATQGWNRAESPADLTIANQTLDDFNYFRDVVFIPNPPTINLPGDVKIDGSIYEKKTLSATIDDPTRIANKTILFQWQKSVDGITWTNIDKETLSSLILSNNLVGNRVRVESTYFSTAASSAYQNYLEFPSSAQKNDWVRVTTTSIIQSIGVTEGEEWICAEAANNGNPPKWEIRSPLHVPAVQPEIKRNILGHTAIPPNTYVIIPLAPPDFIEGPVTPTDEKRTDLSMWFPSVFSGEPTYLDFDLVAYFGDYTEPAGDRQIGICVAEYSNPPLLGARNVDGSLVRGNNGISTAEVNPMFEYPENMTQVSRGFIRSSAQSQTTLRSGEMARAVSFFNELQTIFYVYVWQNSDTTIQVEKVSLSIRKRISNI